MSLRRVAASLRLHLVGLLLLVLGLACGGAEPTPGLGGALPPVDAQAAAPAARAAGTGVPEPGTAVPVTSADPQRGNPLAPITLVVWGDFQCPFTMRLVTQTVPKLEQRYGETLRVVWKNLPLPFHREARPAAIAAETVFRLGGDKAFWTFHALAFDNQKSLSPEQYRSWASQAGVDKGRFQAAFDNQEYAAKIDADIEASKAVGVSGTPASFVNGVFLSGAQPIEKFAEIIDAELVQAEALAKAGVPAERLYAERSEKNRRDVPPPAKHEPKPAEDNKTVWRVPVERSPVRGKADALVTLVMFSDFQCPFCGKVKPTIDALLAQYGDKLRLVAKHDPLVFHPRAEPAAELAIEARVQKGDAAFWKAFDLLFAEQQKLSEQDLEGHAKTLGLDVGRAMQAIRTHKHQAVIQADLALGEGVEANGTPHFFINGRRLVGAQPSERFEQIIDEEIAKTTALVKAGTPATKVYDAIQKDAKVADLERIVVPPATKAQPSKGSPNAKVVIQMFADFQCPFCKRAMPTIDDVLAANPGKVRVVWRHRPLAMHKDAMLASEAAAEVFAQKGDAGFWKFAAMLYEDQGAAGIQRPQLEKRAAELGVDLARFKVALDTHTHQAEIERDAEIADKAGISGTPAFAVDDYYVSGAQPISAFARRIEKAIGPHVPIAPGSLHAAGAAAAAPPPSVAAPAPAGNPPSTGPRLGAKHLMIMYAGSRRASPSITRTRDEARALAEQIAKKARGGARFEELVAQYSDEPGAAARGGDLGTFPKGAMVPEFERALEQLKVGGVSGAVETPFGFHVILRTQ